MTDPSPARRGSTPSAIPSKRPFEHDDEQKHVPAVPSPLNPDFANVRARKAPPAREQREKKESLKKREAKGVDTTRAATPDQPTPGRKTNKKVAEPTVNTQSVLRYSIPLPKAHDFEPTGPPLLVPGTERAGQQFFDAQEHVFNRKGFRYTHCIADPAFRSLQYHRQTEVEPFTPRFDYEDSSSHIQFDRSGTAVTTEKGFRMARANVGVREGRWYWECKILSGVKSPTHTSPASTDSGGHVRMGFCRREASQDTPVGFDAYSYGIRDLAGQRVHKSRPEKFFPEGESACVGDVIGFEINIPSVTLHRKVVEGTYNKAVDVSDDVEPPGAEATNVIRDRIPIRYRNQLYFEQFEYQTSKDMDELLYPPAAAAPSTGAANQAPHPNHPTVALRTLPFSYIKVYKNGQLIGAPFTDLFAFLPPASKPASSSGVAGAREGLDDGTVGYYPCVSVFHGGAARANFGPDFDFPPPDLVTTNGDSAPDEDDVDMVGDTIPPATDTPPAGPASLRRMRPFSERYSEQIAEDVLYDVLDEVDLWTLDQAQLGAGAGAVVPGAPPVTRPAAVGLAGAPVGSTTAVGNGHAGELNEIVQDDE